MNTATVNVVLPVFGGEVTLRNKHKNNGKGKGNRKETAKKKTKKTEESSPKDQEFLLVH